MSKLIVITVLLLSGCAPRVFNAATQFVADPNHAQVTLFRRTTAYSGAWNFVIKVDGREVGKLAPFTYMMLNVPPGRHVITAETEILPGAAGPPEFSGYQFEAVAGQQIYLHAGLTAGGDMGRPLLEVTDQSRAHAEIQNSRRVGAQ